MNILDIKYLVLLVLVIYVRLSRKKMEDIGSEIEARKGIQLRVLCLEVHGRY